MDLAEVVDRRDAVVESSRSGSYRAVGRSGDLDFFEGHGRFVTGRRLQMGDRAIQADRVFLNTGTRVAIPLSRGWTRSPI